MDNIIIYKLSSLAKMEKLKFNKIKTGGSLDNQVNIYKKVKKQKDIKNNNIDLLKDLELTPGQTFYSKRKLKKLARKKFIINKQINIGYCKAVNDCINILQKEFKRIERKINAEKED